MIKPDRKIIELMEIPSSDHDLDWLKESLQAAVKLEYFTLPPYLCALWSVKNDSDPVASSIREHIAKEEMLHMGLACNLLTAIGGVPEINTSEAVPVYPGALPGGVKPDLIVSLQGLSLKAIETFLQIEFPEGGPIALERLGIESFSTIGEFYSAIENAFDSIKPTLSQDRQLGGPLGLKKIVTLDQVQEEIQKIKRQGEGSKASPEDTGPDDLAHYYRFAEIFHGKKLRKDETTAEWRFDGDPVSFPDVWEMAEVPPGGYRREDVSDQVWQLLMQIDQSYTQMVSELQSAWESGDQNKLFDSVSTMFALKEPSKLLMQTPIPSGSGNYGPHFRLTM